MISIITACYNSEKTISDTIKSILNQNEVDLEYIIVDGNSTDSTVEIIKSFENNFIDKGIRYSWISEPDSGVYDAWNKALNFVTGEWIVFIGADDYFINNEVFNFILPHLNTAIEENIRYVYGKINHINDNNELIEVSGKPWLGQKPRLTYHMNIGHSGSFHHVSLFNDYGKFDSSFKIAGDYDFLLREFKDIKRDALFMDKEILVMREGGISSSLYNRLQLVKESKKARKNNKINDFSIEIFTWEIRVRGIIVLSKLFGENFSSKLADFYRLLQGKDKRWS